VTIALVAAAAVVALLVLRALAARRGTSETLDFRGPVHGLEVTIAAGQVTVRGSTRRDARVRRTTNTLRRPRVAEAVDDGVLRLEAPTGIVSYEVDVPARATVTVRGDATSATVINVAGAVQLHAGSGTLEGRGLACRAVRAVTSAGSIRLSFDRAPEVVDVTTRDGSVDLLLPEGDTDIRTDAPGPVRIARR
jgi:DUF4097 and DUF4098 domain-containing protein YvlB